MNHPFDHLTGEEKNLLFRAPVLVSVLASGTLHQKEISKAQKEDAIHLSHLKSFTALPELRSFYAEVEKHFALELDKAVQHYFPFEESSRNALQQELAKVSLILNKLDKKYATALAQSFERYTRHVKKSAHNVFQDFIFPMPIRGLSSS